MIGFRVVNLLIPNDPAQMLVAGSTGNWDLIQTPNFSAARQAILKEHQAAETYFAEHPVDLATDGAAAVERAMDEFLALCVGASYITGLSISAERSTLHSDVTIVQMSSRFPRARSYAGTNAVVTNETEFKDRLEAFMRSFPAQGVTEKALLLVHHWLDALSCWSLEDLYLSATTVLQIIAATEEDKCKKDLSFKAAIDSAASRHGLNPLSGDFKDMRNDLIHDGTLSGTRFGGSFEDCCGVAADVLNWIDEYIHASLALGSVLHTRFAKSGFLGLNAYSL